MMRFWGRAHEPVDDLMVDESEPSHRIVDRGDLLRILVGNTTGRVGSLPVGECIRGPGTASGSTAVTAGDDVDHGL